MLRRCSGFATSLLQVCYKFGAAAKLAVQPRFSDLDACNLQLKAMSTPPYIQIRICQNVLLHSWGTKPQLLHLMYRCLAYIMTCISHTYIHKYMQAYIQTYKHTNIQAAAWSPAHPLRMRDNKNLQVPCNISPARPRAFTRLGARWLAVTCRPASRYFLLSTASVLIVLPCRVLFGGGPPLLACCKALRRRLMGCLASVHSTQFENGLDIVVQSAAADCCIAECCPGSSDRPEQEGYHSSAPRLTTLQQPCQPTQPTFQREGRAQSGVALQ